MTKDPAVAIAAATAVAPAVEAEPPPRRLVITRQLDGLLAIVDSELKASNQLLLLLSKWICRDTRCRNYKKGSCWIVGADTTSHYYPISKTSGRRWAEAIYDGNATIDEPPASIIPAMVIASNYRRPSTVATALLVLSSIASSGYQTFNIHYAPPPLLPPPYTAEPTSSPPTEATDTADEELVALFFAKLRA